MNELEQKIEHTIHSQRTSDDDSYLKNLPFKITGLLDPEGMSLTIAPEGFEHTIELYVRVVDGVPRVSFYNDEGADCLGYVDITISEGVAMVYDRNQSAEPEICEAEENFKREKIAEHLAKKHAENAHDNQDTKQRKML